MFSEILFSNLNSTKPRLWTCHVFRWESVHDLHDIIDPITKGFIIVQGFNCREDVEIRFHGEEADNLTVIAQTVLTVGCGARCGVGDQGLDHPVKLRGEVGQVAGLRPLISALGGGDILSRRQGCVGGSSEQVKLEGVETPAEHAPRIGSEGEA